MCAQYFALLNTVPVPGCEQAELSCVFLISLQENESGLCCWTCTASFLSPRAWGTLNTCINMCLEMGLFLYHLKCNSSQPFSQAGDPGQAEHPCSQMLGVSIYKASRIPVVFINDLRCTESLQMAGHSQNRGKVHMLHAGMLQLCSCEDLLPQCCQWPSHLWNPSLFFSPSCCSSVLIKTQTIKYTKVHSSCCAHPAENRAKWPETR